ncbi:MAG: PIN domain-containing protein [Fimbriimonadales bacterium]|jgi:predicted nucleic acid-binding protein
MEGCLVDTNVFLRMLNRADPLCSRAHQAVNRAIDEGYHLYVAPQILAEFWNVATRPVSANGLGWSVGQTLREVHHIITLFDLLYTQDGFKEFSIWLTIVSQYSVSGKQVHDARLIATMAAHGVRFLLTFNTQDFQRYSDMITILDAAAP